MSKQLNCQRFMEQIEKQNEKQNEKKKTLI